MWLKAVFEMLQIGALRELQRLHDELVESVDTLRLDRYNTSDKYSRWFFCLLNFEPFSSLFRIENLSLTQICVFCVIQKPLVLVSAHAAVFLLTRQRIIPLWRCRHRKNYVDGLILWSIVSLYDQILIFFYRALWFHDNCLVFLGLALGRSRGYISMISCWVFIAACKYG